MLCPDCGKTIGRFRTTADSSENLAVNTIVCPQTGAKRVSEEIIQITKVPMKKTINRRKREEKLIKGVKPSRHSTEAVMVDA